MDELTLHYNADRMELTISPISASRLHNITEVVRCKDCKHYIKSMMLCMHGDGMDTPDKMDFCSYGERREGE